MPHWTKIALKIFSVILGLILLIYIGVAIYVHANKKDLLVSISKELNKGLNGSLTIGGMDPAFLRGFPGVSIKLTHVLLKDKNWSHHRRTLLTAREINIAVNPLALLRGTIQIKKAQINQAGIYVFTDSTGYSNTAVFKKDENLPADKEEKSSIPEIRRFTLDNVSYIIDNQKGHKLFQFQISHLSGKIDYNGSGWEAALKLKTLVKSLAFNTRRGSFMKDKVFEGPFHVQYDNKTKVVKADWKKLKIGKDDFTIAAKFFTGADPWRFVININTKSILWRNAYQLLTPNISKKLKLFNLEKPISIKCKIEGHTGAGGNPLINVATSVRNNILRTPGGGIVQDCNFDGAFTNRHYKEREINDANSLIKLFRFTGTYDEIPVRMDTVAIANLERPVASGLFQSNFDITKLNKVMGADLLKFSHGMAAVNVAYRADIVNFKLTKPFLKGTVLINDASISYVPRGLNFKHTNVSLFFTEKDLQIKNLRLQSGKSVLNMEGNIQNFLNLYYSEPEKILLTWQIRSPEIHLGEFFAFLSQRRPVTVKKKKASTTTFSEDLNMAFEKSRVALFLDIDKVFYHKFMATDAQAELYLTQDGVTIENLSVKHAGGQLKLNGSLTQKGQRNDFNVKSEISNVDIKKFFYSFNNFGLTTLTSENLNGYLFSKVNIKGALTAQGNIRKNSMNGHVIFDLKRGQLLNFKPLVDVGQFAFPLRDLNNITFRNLNGKFDINGEKIKINPMKINSNILNMDVAGVYSLGSGTNIALDVPLRNPKNDIEIDDKEELQKKRMRGIVLHILATDGEDGKIKFKWNKNRD
ncbi:AsmA family protein [Pedobacter immunditicola]|uniref:AsmA family protein n=1 Tax=Pedobacter immunditicola TaxID=3133440 RepID=UPI00309ADE60